MKSLVARLLALYVTAILTACGGPAADLEYLDSRVMPGLDIPPDLTRASVDPEFRLPEGFSADGKGSATGMPVLANVDSIQLEGGGDFYWLSIKEPVDNLYQLVKDFWGSEGFTLVMDEPVIGTMQTNWIFNEEGESDKDQSFIAGFFSSSNLSTTQDQYKTRIVRGVGTAANQIYIAHRGTESKPAIQTTSAKEDGAGTTWGVRASEPELEVEMLSRLMIYLGLRQAEVDRQKNNIKLLAPRASIHTDFTGDETKEETYLLVKDDYVRTWQRCLHHLERLNFDVLDANISKGVLIKKGVMRVETDIETEKDVSGFFSFSSKVETVKKQINLIFSQKTRKITRIDMETQDGEVENSPEGVAFLNLLYQRIR